jgi:hypothetical protein
VPLILVRLGLYGHAFHVSYLQILVDVKVPKVGGLQISSANRGPSANVTYCGFAISGPRLFLIGELTFSPYKISGIMLLLTFLP